MPESLASSWIKSQQIAGVIGAEKKMSRRRENTGNAFPITNLVVPHNFAGAVVERAQRRIRPQVAVAASPPFRFSRDSIVIDAENAAGIHIKQSRLGIEAWRHPIGGSV